MEAGITAIITFSIFAVIVIWWAIVSLLDKLAEGKKEKNDLIKDRYELYDFKKRYDVLQHEYKQELQKLKREIELQGDVIHNVKRESKHNQERYEETVKKKDLLFVQIKEKNNESLEYISSLIADHLTLQYDISAEYLKTKKHPANKEAQRIRELKDVTKEIIQRNKTIQYKYEYLFQLFPDLELYVDDIESIGELSNLNNLGELEDSVDRTRYYLSRDEYDSLSEVERNQLALDRYIQSNKSKWQIGRDYELFIGYEYARDGWNVDYFGIDKQLEDMGRDLIATNGDVTHIVQCKYWAQRKLIHEKHISQLYGTTVQFILSSSAKNKVIPVFVTNISLSETAKSFAEYLDVKIIENKQMSEFPRIKCNVNRDEWGYETRIYHLPMDQQYDRTKICKLGEFFAFSVEEAVNAGFRRAWRWYGNG